mmetsp:Transcript_29173/g.66115  ORF Transcript_29173/g.66115 Transcript_29173/m.66115 type:complete len:86 (-) Transcript_29173:1291-1548(-)
MKSRKMQASERWQVGLIEDGTMTAEMLQDNFNLLSFSNSLVTFSRLICSCYIQHHPQHFAPFLGIDTSDPGAMKREVDAPLPSPC